MRFQRDIQGVPLSPFEPYPIRDAGQEVEMAEDRGTAVLAVQEIVEEQVDEFSQRPECEIADVLCKSKGSESDAHR